MILEAEAAGVHEAMFRDHAAEYGPQIAALVRAGPRAIAGGVERAQGRAAAFRAA